MKDLNKKLRAAAVEIFNEDTVAALEELDEVALKDMTRMEFMLAAKMRDLGGGFIMSPECGQNFFVTTWIPEFKWNATSSLTGKRLCMQQASDFSTLTNFMKKPPASTPLVGAIERHPDMDLLQRPGS